MLVFQVVYNLPEALIVIVLFAIFFSVLQMTIALQELLFSQTDEQAIKLRQEETARYNQRLVWGFQKIAWIQGTTIFFMIISSIGILFIGNSQAEGIVGIYVLSCVLLFFSS